ncbi:ribonuclease H-like domain-containing protein [Tanacetum coccineum]|uniref:Ribonuclease H-like domain-containing protein n=1 Tax=Tanacetum coccineum TaxID=301880 RepID=A0ABQ5BEJ9_9ASTR
MEGVGRINELRDEILVDNRMSRLDCTTKQLIRTTAAISKRWKNLWTQLPHLIFSIEDDITDNGEGYKGQEGLRWPINGNLGRLLPHARGIRFESLREGFPSRAKKEVSRNVEDVDLWLRDARVGYEFTYDDELFFNNLCFNRVKVSYCEFNPPNGAISWGRLECLCLSYVTVYEDMIEKILSGSPCLESLELKNCPGYRRIDVTSRNVKKLVFSNYYYSIDGDYIDCIKINSPYISSLTIKGEFEVKLVLLDVSFLIKVELDYSIDPGMSDDITYEEMLRGLLESLDHVKDVIINDFWWEVYLSSLFGFVSFRPFESLKMSDVERVDMGLQANPLHPQGDWFSIEKRADKDFRAGGTMIGYKRSRRPMMGFLMRMMLLL